MLKFSSLSFLLLVVSGSWAFQPSSRRQMIQQVVAGSFATATAGVVTSSPAVAVVDACPKGSKNCIRTSWTAPAGTDSAEMAKTVLAVLNEYPQAGQQEVDKGGWTFVEEDLKGSGKARAEFKSGIGNFAKFFNGGKPFVDDLILEINGNIVEIKSSSRVGDSDLGVNQKRLAFLASKVKAIGWEAPDPTY